MARKTPGAGESDPARWRREAERLRPLEDAHLTLQIDGVKVYLSTLGAPLRTNGATRGLVGSWGGIAIYASAGIPATQGGSNNEDRPLLLHSPDLWLLTTPANFKATDQGGTTLTQTAIAYRYAALVVRQATAIGTMTGSGCILPSGS